MCSKRIVVYGTGNKSIQFILDNGIENIMFFIEEKKQLKNFYGKPVKRLKDIMLKKEFIVIAVSTPVYFGIKETLEELGLYEFEDFIFYKLYNKKIAMIYGNCHTIPIKEGLSLTKEFYKEYGFYPLKQIQEMKRTNALEDSFKVLEKCDLFIHQSIRKENLYGEEYASENLLSKLKNSCKIIAIPNLYGLGNCFFPQTYKREGWSTSSGNTLFPYRDRFIDKYYKEGYSVEKIVKILKDDNLIDTAEIIHNLNLFFDKVRMREREWNIKIFDFLVSNYQKQQIFYDPYHPTNVVIKYIIIQILYLLYPGYIWESDIYDYISKLDEYEIPIYSSISNILSLQYKKTYLRENSKARISDTAMDLEEYVREYLMFNF